MKLFKKLLPLATIASTAAIIAPVLSSCSNKLSTTDLTKTYISTIKQADAEELEEDFEDLPAKEQQEIIQDLYFDHVSKHPEIIQDDISVYESKRLYGDMSQAIDEIKTAYHYDNVVLTDIEATVSTSTPKIIKKRVEEYGGEKHNLYFVSLQLNYVYNYTLLGSRHSLIEGVDNTFKITSNTSFESKYTDIPVAVWNNSGKWFVEADAINNVWLSYSPDWKFDFSKTTNTQFTYSGADGEETTESTSDTISDSFSKAHSLNLGKMDNEYLSMSLAYPSYHLEKLNFTTPISENEDLNQEGYYQPADDDNPYITDRDLLSITEELGDEDIVYVEPCNSLYSDPVSSALYNADNNELICAIDPAGLVNNLYDNNVGCKWESDYIRDNGLQAGNYYFWVKRGTPLSYTIISGDDQISGFVTLMYDHKVTFTVEQ